MWANIIPPETAAFGKRLTSALEQTGDVITKHAQAAAQAHVKQQKKAASEEKDNNTTTKDGTNNDPNTITSEENADVKPTSTTPNPQAEVLSSLKSGWGSVLEATKQAVETTRVVVEKEQTRLHAHFSNKGPYRRDLHLPLDADALRDAEVVYITDRIISMGHPAMQSAVDGDITADRKLAAVGHLLRKRHDGKFMVWNLSELDYEYDVLDDQVMAWCFPGSPAPPLGKLIKILISIESWLKADKKNVAVVHCLTGKGRTSTVLAALLCWVGEAGFVDPNISLDYIAACKKIDVESLTIPSQRRYVSYFSNMLDGVRPSQPPLLLKRVIMNEAPKFGRAPDIDEKPADTQELGCAPYLQIFKSGKLVFTAAASKSYTQKQDDLPFCVPSDGAITFPIETIVQGDILVRCRHLSRKGQRISMFRAAFHTGYVPPKVLRLTKGQLDGSSDDDRYPEGFFIDLIFEECDAKMAAAHIQLLQSQGDEEEQPSNYQLSPQGKKGNESAPKENLQNEAAARRMCGTVGGGPGSDSEEGTLYDSMLHRDSRFWDLISNRREANRNKIMSSSSHESDGNGSNDGSSQFYGPTIGRRREFAHEKKQSDNVSRGTDASSGSKQSGGPKSAMETFSIGGGLDFMDDEEEIEQKSRSSSIPSEKEAKANEKKKDDLMDALNAIDDDVDVDVDQDDDIVEGDDKEVKVEDDGQNDESSNATEEINFESDDADCSTQKSEVSIATATGSDMNNDAPGASTSDSHEEVAGSSTKSSQDDSDLVKVPSTAGESDNMGSSGDFDFDDDDDDELEDLENFLKSRK